MSAQEEQRVPGTSEEEPLLGRSGDASLEEGKPLYYNLVLGTGVVAQAGVWILTAIVWGAVFSSPLSLFSAHPLLNSAALLFFIQGTLILQPTHTASQKHAGTLTHSALNNVAVASALAGLVIIEYNKISHGGTHFVSTHAILGLTVYILTAVQAFVGLTQFFTPALYGGKENARKLYKYHRVSGYVVLALMLATVAAATSTDFNKNVLGMQLWAVVAASVITIVGIVPRIRLSKFGWLAGK
ncbi:hypothetical protein B0A48_03230 [Cryoendolithus antarcticus]|uniref:Cytochrome b561 domain-containing protein n=1 Tax=Cryoendolithus antarcticus TaxID=1507870 RepID=A0A1V8TJE3_9PEZI|nr:hypothetical protein B0A48_03230 [Cryoendolithus antarcticus]